MTKRFQWQRGGDNLLILKRRKPVTCVEFRLVGRLAVVRPVYEWEDHRDAHGRVIDKRFDINGKAS